MPAPQVPVELREFPEPVLEPGSVLLRTLYSEVCGTDVHIWHGRLAGVPYPIIPGHVSVGIADKIRGDVRGVDGAASPKATAWSSSTSTAPAGAATPARSRGRRRAARRGASTASPTRPATGCSAAGPRRSTSSRASRCATLPESVPAEDLHRRRLRPDHGRPRHRSRGARVWAIPCWSRAPARSGSASIALARLAGATPCRRDSAPGRSPGARRRDGRRSPCVDIGRPRAGGAHADRARPHRRARRRRRHRGGRIGARGRGGVRRSSATAAAT